MDYRQEIAAKQQARKTTEILARQRYFAILAQHSDLQKIENELKELQIKKIEGKSVAAKKIADLTKQRADYLKKIGVLESQINPLPQCNMCGDFGYANDIVCQCIVNLVAAKNSSSLNNFAVFDNFDLNIFAKEDKKDAKYAFDTAQAFAKKFPNTSNLNFILLGKTGTGKTFLASCIHSAITKKGYSSVFTSAFNFVNRCLASHLAPSTEKLGHITPFLDADLLIIDDLGTESILQNVTREYLLNIVNERILNKKHTVVTTNLDDVELKERYCPRLISRLFDEKLSIGLSLAEVDLRGQR